MADHDEGPRARARRQTQADLHAAAMAEIREHGPVALSLRRVARRMGMSPAGLYRYVDSREDLLTRLITAAYDDLADHLLVAIGAADERSEPDAPVPALPEVVGADGDVAARLRAVALAYRHWSVTHPQQFALLFGDPIPGYAAPPGGPTVVAMGRVGAALGRPLVEGWSAGRLRIPAAWTKVAALDAIGERIAPLSQLDGVDLPPEVGIALLLAWGRLHGQVSLEVFGHHTWLFPAGCAPLYVAEVEAFLDQLLPAA
ncbi:MAG TPA: TetR/AcrR family transcriptional regulator [Egicoccus sp.]|nr:TetR/AcrR family transcriptional regulator [Egicoccus sp.]HSK22912.1 TetR/AcrR family transcriptional regulator [Egicoccus sp.]